MARSSSISAKEYSRLLWSTVALAVFSKKSSALLAASDHGGKKTSVLGVCVSVSVVGSVAVCVSSGVGGVSGVIHAVNEKSRLISRNSSSGVCLIIDLLLLFQALFSIVYHTCFHLSTAKK